MSTPARVLAYSFDGMGLGHMRRNLTLINALRAHAKNAAVLTVTGSAAVDRFPIPDNVDVLRLPGLLKTAVGTSRPARLPIPTEDVRHMRSALLASAVRSFAPDLVLVDFYPLGREGELAAAVEEACRIGARLVLGLRDILDAPETVRKEWHDTGQLAAAERLYDTVLVYGDASVYDTASEYAFPDGLAAKTVYTGYLTTQPSQAEPWRSYPEIVCTMGGGSDAVELAQVFVEAVRPLVENGRTAMLLTGPFMPSSDVALLRADAPVGLTVETFVADAPTWFDQAECVVSMAGYNTTCEVLAAGVPTVFVPRSRPRLEQRIRATRISARTGWHVLLPEDLEQQPLRELIVDALTMPKVASSLVRTDGVATAGRVLAEALSPQAREAL